ncbi:MULTISPECIES: pyrroloquinoline quinone biosynthesis protein PqqE [Xanthobacter]|uniref:pyrroloquinoline quinone biosynthesis protein PqqE n=1 Tax=Xanthobacter TaxID=279 RepID=UPI0024A75FD1|nr:pyrroloquinoline quinone biosynthesis protein PqqE [Xanthobacter autotrophicus]MDI4657384.1 pyrroloquinoline quinone biosynthesis protein PqqE [Xanthobacter autotrophicus]MDI4665518.1 pyrroloquinoline quinone biosynthesis protein PqqE [Xanthobacter autotrophicus]
MQPELAQREPASRGPAYRPWGLLAELTHRCPLACPYCSNPLALVSKNEELDTETWLRVLTEAAALGVRQVHLSGGEPTTRSDIVEITAACRRLGLYSNLITSGVGAARAKLPALAEAGLDHVQLSLQGVNQTQADAVGGLAGSHQAKLAFAADVTACGLPLTLNAVIHRGNIHDTDAMIDFALRLGARRLEVAHTQFYGWALANRAALMPAREDVVTTIRRVQKAQVELKGRLAIDLVVPDYFARYPKACCGGWGRRLISVTPAGKVLPCHAAETIPGLTFFSCWERSLAEIWASPAFEAFRGTDWMQEPCRSCDRKEWDFGGCRCQAFALTGDAAATDPACSFSPEHARISALATQESTSAPPPYIPRRAAKDVVSA